MKQVVVVGSGAGGATVALHLQESLQVTVLEAGHDFVPLPLSLRWMERLKRGRVLVSPRLIELFFPVMRIAKTLGGVVVTGRCTGGSTSLCAGNMIRWDEALREIGIDLDEEFLRLTRLVPVDTSHRRLWRPITQKLWDAFVATGLEPEIMPKGGEYGHCRQCGRCVVGCPYGVKWDSRRFLQGALTRGAHLLTGWHVDSVEIRGAEARGVWAHRGMTRRFFPADMVILAAGGLGTPGILRRSGVMPRPTLFVDPVLWVVGPWENSHHHAEMSMPFFTRHEGFILSPYFDLLSFLFCGALRSRARDVVGIMVKVADSAEGSVGRRGPAKVLNDEDRRRLELGAGLCGEILERIGVPRRTHMRGILNAGHPGGMVPLTREDANTLHPPHLPGNLFVADASLLPRSLGAPPILTILALALRVARRVPAALGGTQGAA